MPDLNSEILEFFVLFLKFQIFAKNVLDVYEGKIEKF